MTYSSNVDPEINQEEVLIPNMILQPYIENAIWHGLSHKKDGNRKIQIQITKGEKGIRYEIEDNGVGRQQAAELKSLYRKGHKSKGMELLSKRFKLLSEEYRQQIETHVADVMQNNVVAGTRVTILVPWDMGRELKQRA